MMITRIVVQGAHHLVVLGQVVVHLHLTDLVTHVWSTVAHAIIHAAKVRVSTMLASLYNYLSPGPGGVDPRTLLLTACR